MLNFTINDTVIVAEILVLDIPFDENLVEYCEANACGNYGRCYTCPPLVGIPKNLIDYVKTFSKAYIFQKVYKLEDSFDIEGMNASNDDFRRITAEIAEHVRSTNERCLMLGAGGCKLCKICAINRNLPCNFPEKRIPSLESYCIDVATLSKKCKLKYINGVNTVTYFGAVIL